MRQALMTATRPPGRHGGASASAPDGRGTAIGISDAYSRSSAAARPATRSSGCKFVVAICKLAAKLLQRRRKIWPFQGAPRGAAHIDLHSGAGLPTPCRSADRGGRRADAAPRASSRFVSRRSFAVTMPWARKPLDIRRAARAGDTGTVVAAPRPGKRLAATSDSCIAGSRQRSLAAARPQSVAPGPEAARLARGLGRRTVQGRHWRLSGRLIPCLV